MLFKILIAVLGLAAIGFTLLSLQQQRLLMAHAMSDLHVQMDQDRKNTWDAQAAIAERAHPVALRAAIRRVGLNLAPLPTPTGAASPTPAWPDPARFSHAPRNQAPAGASPATHENDAAESPATNSTATLTTPPDARGDQP